MIDQNVTNKYAIMKHSTIVLKYFFVSDNETLRIFPFLSEQSLIYYPWFTNYDVTIFPSHRHGRAYTTALNKPKSWSNHLPVRSKRKSFAKSQRKNTTLLTSSRRVVRVRWKRGKKKKRRKKIKFERNTVNYSITLWNPEYSTGLWIMVFESARVNSATWSRISG